jgi:hypothetical protein
LRPERPEKRKVNGESEQQPKHPFVQIAVLIRLHWHAGELTRKNPYDNQSEQYQSRYDGMSALSVVRHEAMQSSA